MPKVVQQAAFTAEGTIPDFAKPASDLATFNPLVMHPAPQGGQWLFVWANYFRKNGDANPPVVNGRGFRYTSIDKANMATLAKLRSAFIGPASAQALCARQGLRFCTWGDLATLATMPVVGGHYRNVAYCPPLISDKVKGYILDYECGDGRSSDDTAGLFRRIVGELPGVPRMLYTNQMGSAGYRGSGLQGLVLKTPTWFHCVSIFQDRNERLLLEQFKALGRYGRKAVVTIDLKTNDLTSVRYARNFVLERRLPGVHFWRNGVDLGLASTAQKLALFNTWVTS